MPDPIDDLCVQLGCMDNRICWRYAEDPDARPHACHRATAVAVGAAKPYSLRLGAWHALLRRVGLSRLLPKEAANAPDA